MSVEGMAGGGQCSGKIKSVSLFFVFQADDGIRGAQESRGLGDVDKRQRKNCLGSSSAKGTGKPDAADYVSRLATVALLVRPCLLYTSDAADDLLCVDFGGRRII